jgi:hypothetical protein
MSRTTPPTITPGRGGTLSFRDVSKYDMIAGNERNFTTVIVRGEIKDWVGFGWITIRDATQEDADRYPVVQ